MNAVFLGLWALAGGCTFDFASIPVLEGDLSEDDAGGGRGFPDPEPGERHQDCAAGVPDPLPAEPVIALDELGLPSFATWQDLDCAGLGEVRACAEADGCTCLDGLCLEAGDAPLSYDAGQCRLQVPPALKAALCCANSARVDCRGYPFGARSRIGESCVRHDDCERGLLCRQEAEHGVCACPDEPLPSLTTCLGFESEAAADTDAGRGDLQGEDGTVLLAGQPNGPFDGHEQGARDAEGHGARAE